MLRSSLAIAGLLLTIASAGAQETYPLQVKESTVGDSTVVQRTQTIRNLTVVSDIVDTVETQVMRNEDLSTESVAYGETILAKEPGQPATRLRRKYQTAQVQAPNRVADLPYAGTTVLIEKKGDQFGFQTAEGRVLGADVAPRLDKEFNHGWAGPLELERLLLAKVPVRSRGEMVHRPGRVLAPVPSGQRHGNRCSDGHWDRRAEQGLGPGQPPVWRNCVPN